MIATETWIVLGALSLVAVIAAGAIRPMIARDRKRRDAKEQDND